MCRVSTTMYCKNLGPEAKSIEEHFTDHVNGIIFKIFTLLFLYITFFIQNVFNQVHTTSKSVLCAQCLKYNHHQMHASTLL